MRRCTKARPRRPHAVFREPSLACPHVELCFPTRQEQKKNHNGSTNKVRNQHPTLGSRLVFLTNHAPRKQSFFVPRQGTAPASAQNSGGYSLCIPLSLSHFPHLSLSPCLTHQQYKTTYAQLHRPKYAGAGRPGWLPRRLQREAGARVGQTRAWNGWAKVRKTHHWSPFAGTHTLTCTRRAKYTEGQPGTLTHRRSGEMSK